MDSTFLFLLFIFVITGISLSMVPYLTRKSESFGVTIPESIYNNNELKKMRRQYTFLTLILVAILTTSLFIIHSKVTANTLIIIYIGILFVFLLLSFLIYLPFHFKVKKIKQQLSSADHIKDVENTINVTTSHTATNHKQTTYSNKLYVIPFLIVVITIFYTFSIYDIIPDQVPRHISASGKITYTDKSPGILLLLPFTQLFMIGIFLIINYVINQSEQKQGTIKQTILFKRRWSLFMFIMGTVIVLLFSFLQLSFIYEDLLDYIDPVMYTTIGLILIGTIALSIHTGQGGSRIKVDDTNKDVKQNQRLDDDHHWKLGQFYYNKNDPAIFVEKRFGIGWSVNFAKPIVWVLFGGIIILAFLPLILLLFN